ncbi:MAG: hypothetical protein ILO36_04135 [Abditibacteriota bacterium]|nr:hypothetical protein [Abditibacteriota bacterium]
MYIPQVTFYNRDFYKAGHIIVNKQLFDESVWKQIYGDKHFFSYGGFICDNNENVDQMCEMLPLVSRIEKYDRFEILQYDAGEYIDYIKKYPYSTSFSVVKDRGKVIWYNEGEVPEDIAITADGRYMIATMYSVFYTSLADGRIISEMYSGNRYYLPGNGTPDNVAILTDNIIRTHFKSGTIEHWKVRLSEEDVEKNMENNEKRYGSKEKHAGGDRCLLWSNRKQQKLNTETMWCFYESEEEPVYKETNLADVRTAGVSAFKRVAYSSAAGNRPAKAASAGGNGQVEKAASANAANSAGEAKTGFFASLFGRIKTFLAGLFA